MTFLLYLQGRGRGEVPLYRSERSRLRLLSLSVVWISAAPAATVLGAGDER